MTATNPDQIRREIEQTRGELSHDVNALTQKVSPKRIVNDRVERTRGAIRTVKEKIMGTASGMGHRAGDTVSSVTGGMSSAASSVGDAASSAASSVQQTAAATPTMVRERTEGNPLAAGLIAFGAGVLISSLFPPSRRERELAGQLKDTAAQHSGEIRQQVTEAAQQMRDNLREPAQQAVESVKATASEGVQTVREEGRSAVGDVRDEAQQARDTATRR